MRRTHSWYRIYEYCLTRWNIATPRYKPMWQYLIDEAFTHAMTCDNGEN